MYTKLFTSHAKIVTLASKQDQKQEEQGIA
jgi:hypothetical protein